MNQTLQRLKDIEKNGYTINFGDIINEAFENYKKIALYAGLVLFVFGILFILFISAALIATLGAQFVAEEISPEKLKAENLSPSILLIINGITLAISCLLSPFQASFLQMAHNAKIDSEFKIADLFRFYSLEYLPNIMAATFLIGTFGLLQANLWTNLNLELLGVFINYCISFVTILAIPLIIFGKLPVFEALKYSIIIVSKHPIAILGLVLVAITAAMVGILGCCIGLLFTIPLCFSINYCLYSSIVGIDRDDQFPEEE